MARSVVKRSVAVRSLAVLPLAGVLLAGCGGQSDEEKAAEQLQKAADQLNTSSATSLEDAQKALEDSSGSLEDLAGGIDLELTGDTACESLAGILQAVRGSDQEIAREAVASGVNMTLDMFADGASAEAVDFDGLIKNSCSDSHAEALKLTGLNSLNDLPEN